MKASHLILKKSYKRIKTVLILWLCLHFQTKTVLYYLVATISTLQFHMLRVTFFSFAPGPLKRLSRPWLDVLRYCDRGWSVINDMPSPYDDIIVFGGRFFLCC